MRILLFFLVALIPSSLWAEEVADDRYAQYEGMTITKLTIAGNRITKDFVILRELRLKEGDEFSSATLEDDLQRLENLGIFSSMEGNLSEYEGGVALEVQVQEMPWLVPYPKIKYIEENGWSFGAGLSSMNMAGRNIYLSGGVLFGGNNTYSIYMDYPWITANHLSLELLARHLIRDDELRDFEETSDEITPWVGTYLGHKGRLAGTISYFRMKSDVDGITLDPDNIDNLLRIGGRIGYDSRDSWRNTHSGWDNELMVMKTGGSLGGDGDSWLTNLDLRRYQPITENNTLLIGGLVTTQSGKANVDVPSYLQYHLGGANTIRGYDVIDLGKKMFGNNQMIVTIEYQYTLMPLKEYKIVNWFISAGLELALFMDTGVAWNENEDFAYNRFKTGYGAGLRILVPGVDVLRLDLAFSEDGGHEFHLGILPKFDAQQLRVR